jgi:hypothetical protein
MIVAVPGARRGVVVAPEVGNRAARESRVRSKEPKAETLALPAVDTKPQLDCIRTWANEAVATSRVGGARPAQRLLRAKFAACSDQSDRGPVSNVLHELAIGGTAGPAACRSTPL